MNPTFRGFVDEAGRLRADHPERLKAHLLKLKNREVVISVEKQTNARSQNQNRYYWGVVLKLIADDTGHTPEEVHDIMRAKFLTEPVDFKGKRYEVVRSTTSLDTIAFEDYVEKCRVFAAQELGIVVPMPGEINIEE